MKDFFAGEGNWLKGNLHTHTTVSDGTFTPQQTAALYREHGYDFLCITDHHRCSEAGEADGLLLLAGVELNRNEMQPRVCYHLTGAGLLHPVDLPPTAEPQAMIDALREAGAFVTLAHPAWSLMTDAHIRAVHGYDAIEIYNSVSEFYSGRGDSSVQMDTLAAGGILPRVTAADDVHFYGPDACHAFVMVKAASRTREGILEALYANRFYASQGPRLHSLVRDDDGVIRVTCSPLRTVLFFSDRFYDGRRVQNAPAGGSLTAAEYAPAPEDTWVRVEGIDAAGRRVWSNYIDLR